MKLIFTGGHHNSALAVAVFMRDTYGADIVWIGHRHTSLYDKNDSAEYKEVTKAGIPFKNLIAGKLYKTLDLRQWVRVPIGFVQAFWYVLRDRPHVIVSFGGYLAVPVVLAGFLLRVPSVTHEQTVVTGLANRLIGRFAQKVFLTWPQSLKHFSSAKAEVVGLPLRKEIFENSGTFDQKDSSLKTIYITAGKQGSHVINVAVVEVLEEILNKYKVIHQCGSTSQFNDFEWLDGKRSSLPKHLQERYILRQYIYRDEVGSAFSNAHIVVSRAGAHTVYELAALGIPAVLIPIPWVSHNEQYENAKILEQAGAGYILEQKDLSGASLLQAIDTLEAQYVQYAAGANEAQNLITLGALEAIAESIYTVASHFRK